MKSLQRRTWCPFPDLYPQWVGWVKQINTVPEDEIRAVERWGFTQKICNFMGNSLCAVLYKKFLKLNSLIFFFFIYPLSIYWNLLCARHFPGTGNTEINRVPPLPSSCSLSTGTCLCWCPPTRLVETCVREPGASALHSNMLEFLPKRSCILFTCPFWA